MKWIAKIIRIVFNWIGLAKKKHMAKITLEDDKYHPIEFDLSDLIYIGYDEGNNWIVLVLANKSPIYLPPTKGNVDFLQMISPYFRQKAASDPKVAANNIVNKPKVKI